MKDFEKDLKKIIDKTEGGVFPVHQNESGLSEDQLRSLSAKNMIKLKPAGNNQFFPCYRS